MKNHEHVVTVQEKVNLVLVKLYDWNKHKITQNLYELLDREFDTDMIEVCVRNFYARRWLKIIDLSILKWSTNIQIGKKSEQSVPYPAP